MKKLLSILILTSALNAAANDKIKAWIENPGDNPFFAICTNSQPSNVFRATSNSDLHDGMRDVMTLLSKGDCAANDTENTCRPALEQFVDLIQQFKISTPIDIGRPKREETIEAYLKAQYTKVFNQIKCVAQLLEKDSNRQPLFPLANFNAGMSSRIRKLPGMTNISDDDLLRTVSDSWMDLEYHYFVALYTLGVVQTAFVEVYNKADAFDKQEKSVMEDIMDGVDLEQNSQLAHSDALESAGLQEFGNNLIRLLSVNSDYIRSGAVFNSLLLEILFENGKIKHY